MTTARMVCPALPLVAGGTGMLGPTPALADNPGKRGSAVWRVMDKCTLAAQKKFPDYTDDAIAKREADVHQCLRAANRPGDVDLPQPSAEQR